MKSTAHDLLNHVSVVSSYIDLLSLSDMTLDQVEICDEMRKAIYQAIELSRFIESSLQDGESS